jgi:hypothetical protein
MAMKRKIVPLKVRRPFFESPKMRYIAGLLGFGFVIAFFIIFLLSISKAI